MDYGQHLRLWLKNSNTYKVIGLATDLQIHGSATTENSTTKDDGDAYEDVVWDMPEVMTRSVDIQFSGLIGAGTDTNANTLADIETKLDNSEIDFDIAMASGSQNRTKGQLICSGKGKITNLQMTGQVDQNATYQGTLKVYGPLTVGSD